MTKKTMVDIRAMGPGESGERLFELRSELAKERAVIASGTRPENPGNVRKIRREIARVLTAINEKRDSPQWKAAEEEAAKRKATERSKEKKARAEKAEKESEKKAAVKKKAKAAKTDTKKVKKTGKPKNGLKKKKEVKK